MKYLVKNNKGVYYIYESPLTQLWVGYVFSVAEQMIEVIQAGIEEVPFILKPSYRLVEEGDDLMTVDEFLFSVDDGYKNDNRGHGYASVDGITFFNEHRVEASGAFEFFDNRQGEFNYVVWFNK